MRRLVSAEMVSSLTAKLKSRGEYFDYRYIHHATLASEYYLLQCPSLVEVRASRSFLVIEVGRSAAFLATDLSDHLVKWKNKAKLVRSYPHAGH